MRQRGSFKLYLQALTVIRTAALPFASPRQNDITGSEKPRWRHCHGMPHRVGDREKMGSFPTDGAAPLYRRSHSRRAQPAQKQAETGAAGVLDHTVLMPLMNTPFQPGTCVAAVRAMEAGPRRDIAWAEYCYFTGQPDKAARAEGAFVAATSSVLLHLPLPRSLPSVKEFLPLLPPAWGSLPCMSRPLSLPTVSAIQMIPLTGAASSSGATAARCTAM